MRCCGGETTFLGIRLRNRSLVSSAQPLADSHHSTVIMTQEEIPCATQHERFLSTPLS
jgi:hypothetical protein